MRVFLLAICISISGAIVAKNTGDSIYKNAFAIKNYEHVTLDIDGIDRATYFCQKSITVLSAKASDLLNFEEFTDQFTKLEDVSIKLYDAFGKLQESYSKKDLDKRGVSEGLVIDDYLYYKDIVSKSFPCIIEVEYTVKYKGFLGFPSFRISSSGVAAKQLSYTINCKKNDINFKLYGTTQKPIITEGDGKTYKWKFEQIQAQVFESGANDEQRLHAVKISPRQFSLDGVQGEFSSWNKFGEWYGQLSANEKTLSPQEQQEILNLVANAVDNKEKAKIIYQYLQKNYRYVNISLGIGGFKPFPASFTHKKKYGDCKALSNYMQACMSVVGINSYQALINAGTNGAPVDESFPATGFNHVILCIPQDKDTIWLECTSNLNAFNNLGSFTENRKALLITEKGGVLVNTPKSSWSDNLFYSKTIIDPANEGNNVNLQLYCTGEFLETMKIRINDQPLEQQLKFFHYALSAKQPDDFKVNYQGSTYNFALNYNKLQEFNAGSKYFYAPSIFPIMDEEMPETEKRSLDFYFDNPYQNIDTVEFVLGDNYTVESLPESKIISNNYFYYETKFIENKATKTLQCIHQFKMMNHIIAAKDFAQSKKMLAEIKEQMDKKLILRKR